MEQLKRSEEHLDSSWLILEEFKWILLVRFKEECDAGFWSILFRVSLPDHMVENIQRLRVLSVLDNNPYVYYNVRM